MGKLVILTSNDGSEIISDNLKFWMMKNVFYFMLKALFVLEIFIFLPGLFDYVDKRVAKKEFSG